MNEKISKSYTMCIQMVTQVFAELWKDNHHANFLLINKKKYIQKTDTNFTTTVLSFSVLVCKKYSNTIIASHTIILGYSWAYDYSWIFPDILGTSWAYNYSCEAARIRKQKIIKFCFVGLFLYGLFFIFLMQFMELTVHSK